MKLFKKIAIAFLASIVLFLFGGYLYFQKKFTPSENYLTVSRTTENLPLKWISSADNSYAALLFPVKIKDINQTFYMQFDSGSPITVFYKNSLASIAGKFPNQIKIKEKEMEFSNTFSIGKMKITSNTFEVLNYGEKVDFDNPKSENIIGTIGTDLLERRITILDFKNNKCSFAEKMEEKDFTNFEFKKRKILIQAKVDNHDFKLLYDSGTSGYELITQKEIWETYKNPNSKIKKEKGNSWGNTLSVFSASANKQMLIENRSLQISEVTYIEGTSKLQNFLMKSSGMQGMIGNKIFLNHTLILDCKNEKIKLD